MAYFYFDFKDAAKQTSENLTRSLISQFSARCHQLPSSVSALYSSYLDGQQQPSRSSLTLCLKQLLEDLPASYIVIDALDECTDRDDLLDLIEQIHGWRNDHLYILATSRKEIDIYDALNPLVSQTVCIQDHDTREDIRQYVTEEIKRNGVLRNRSLGIRKDIEDTLIKRADGMYVNRR